MLRVVVEVTDRVAEVIEKPAGVEVQVLDLAHPAGGVAYGLDPPLTSR